jgi:hypothetical protein
MVNVKQRGAGWTSLTPRMLAPRSRFSTVTTVFSMTPDAEHPFLDLIRPFAEKLVLTKELQEPGKSSEAIEAIVRALTQWCDNVVAYASEIDPTTLTRIKDFASSLNQELMPFRFRYEKPGWTPDQPGWARCDLAQVRAFLRVIGGGTLLNDVLKGGTPPIIDVNDLCAVLTKIVEGIPPPAPRPKGKPYGIKKYPKLDLLVYDLCVWAETYLAIPLRAYVKVGEKKVAAGSLIDALDALREYLDRNCHWLAAYLPMTTDHPACVTTYNRLIAEARDAVSSERERAASSPQ